MDPSPKWLCLLACCLLPGEPAAWAQYSHPGTPTPAVAPGQSFLQQNTLEAAPSVGPQPAPSVLAPATPIASDSNGPAVLDTSTRPKFYTISASLREAYDDNVYTTRYDRISSPVTEISPSLLINLPARDSTFSGRVTLGLDYYPDRPGNKFDKTAEILLHYTHQFTDRFSLDLREQGGYYEQPDLIGGEGTPFFSGAYFLNTITGVFSAQWTPLFGTTTTYTNVALQYQDQGIGSYQNSDENIAEQDFRFAIYPKLNLVAGLILDDLDYYSVNRGYDTYTLNGGVDWQALPTLSLSVRGGIELTYTDDSSSEVSPYIAITVNWNLGKRSVLNASYTHSVAPTDVFDALGEEADRFSLRFDYQLTSRISVHAAGTFTYADYTGALLEAGVSTFNEIDLGLDLGAEYAINSNFSIETGYSLSDVSSGRIRPRLRS